MYKLGYEQVNVDIDEGYSSEKEILMELGFPLEEYFNKYPDDVLAYCEELVCQTILDILLEDGGIEGLFTLNDDNVLIEYFSNDSSLRSCASSSLGFGLKVK